MPRLVDRRDGRLRGNGGRRPRTRVTSSEPAAAPDRVRGDARYLPVAYGTGGNRLPGRAGARQDPNADARIHELRPPAPHGPAGAGVGYVGAPGTDRGDGGVPPSWRDDRGSTQRGLWERFRVEASVIEHVDHPSDPGVDTLLQYRDRHRSLGGGTGRTAAGLTCRCASRLLTLECG